MLFRSLVDMDQLRERRDGRVDNFIAEDDGKRFVADQMLGAEHGMTEAERDGLTDVTKVRQGGDMAHLTQELALARSFEIFFEFDRAIEVVFDGPFPAAGDDDDVFNSGCDGFFDDILDQGFVDQGEHLFRRCFRGREKAGTKACSRDNGFSNRIRRHAAIVCDGIGEVKKPGKSARGTAVCRYVRIILYIIERAQYNPEVLRVRTQEPQCGAPGRVVLPG